jgi:hypothetical protein
MTVADVTHFYKYKAPPDNLEWLSDVIVRHQLYFPLPRELNDPAEARPLLDISAAESEAFLYRQWCKENPSASNDAAEQALEDIREGIAVMGPDKFYGRMIDGLHEKYARRRIFSLSKRWDNMSMWAKYAADHRGYCLEFANAGLFAANFTREVEYVDAVTVNPADESELGKFYFRKKRDWSNEEEVRVLSPRNVSPIVTIDPTLLTRIILGKDMAADLRAQIVRWAQERNPALVVQRADYDPTRQTLRLVEESVGSP